MDATKFMELYGQAEETGGMEGAKEVVRESLSDDAKHHFFDLSGDGTHYRCSGVRHGVGFSRCDVIVGDNDLVTVRASIAPVMEGRERDLGRLCRMWNKRFILEGLTVEDGEFVFVTEAFYPAVSGMDCARAVGLALSTVHAYASATLALEGGAEPWDLIDLDGHRGGRGGSGDDDDDSGIPVERLQKGAELLERLIRERTAQQEA
ncbi:MAG: hypothetical protein IKG18_14295 [Atopobiaceae bacterium]|nr:hypothetical protein [Atopobiaceae bacterium]